MAVKTLMKLMVECPGTYREAALSDPQLELFDLLKGAGPVNSAWVAEALGISLHSASTRLKVLFQKKYLTRKDRVSPSGGRAYEYTAVDYSRGADLRFDWEARELLTKYSRWLEDHGYLDCDWWAEEPGEETAADRFIEDQANE